MPEPKYLWPYPYQKLHAARPRPARPWWLWPLVALFCLVTAGVVLVIGGGR